MDKLKSLAKVIGLIILYPILFQILNVIILGSILIIGSKLGYTNTSAPALYYLIFLIGVTVSFILTPTLFWKVFIIKMNLIKSDKNKNLTKKLLILTTIALALFNFWLYAFDSGK